MDPNLAVVLSSDRIRAMAQSTEPLGLSYFYFPSTQPGAGNEAPAAPKPETANGAKDNGKAHDKAAEDPMTRLANSKATCYDIAAKKAWKDAETAVWNADKAVTIAKYAQSKDKKAAAEVAADKAENAEKAIRLAKRANAKFVIATAEATAARAAVNTSDAAAAALAADALEAARAAVKVLEDLEAMADAACARKVVDALIAAADAAAARAAAEAGNVDASFAPVSSPFPLRALHFNVKFMGEAETIAAESHEAETVTNTTIKTTTIDKAAAEEEDTENED
jgi:hypothetical protein